MTLSPDEIAKRSFTPSADGYHQGEVREFLARVASERRAMLTALPQGQRHAAELALAIANHEQRLHSLEERLARAVEKLEQATNSLQNAQERASQHVAATRKAASDQRSLVDRLRTPASPAAEITASAPPAPSPAPKAATASVPTSPSVALPDTSAVASRAAAFLSGTPSESAAPARQPTVPPSLARPAVTATEPAPKSQGEQALDAVVTGRTVLPPRPIQPSGPLPASDPVAAGATTAETSGVPLTSISLARPSAPEPTPEATAPSMALPVTPTPTAPAATTPPRPAPPAASTTPPPPPPPPPPAAATLPSSADLLRDLDRKPLITDNANDLLDGVLDDVMGDLNERPNA